MNKPNDMEWYKAIQREKARQEIVRMQQTQAKQKLEEANKRLYEVLFGKK